jgi:hypothetical protein
VPHISAAESENKKDENKLVRMSELLSPIIQTLKQDMLIPTPNRQVLSGCWTLPKIEKIMMYLIPKTY